VVEDDTGSNQGSGWFVCLESNSNSENQEPYIIDGYKIERL